MNIQSEQTAVREPIIVTAKEYKGRDRVDVRHYFYNSSDELAPTEKGVNLPLEQAQALVEAVNQAAKNPSTVRRVQPALEAHLPILVTINEHKGVSRMDTRHYWLPEGASELAPTRKGISMSMDKAFSLLDALSQVVSAALKEREEHPRRCGITMDGRFQNVEL